MIERATFRDVLAVGEARAVFAAGALSWAGDMIAKAALTYLVYSETKSVGLSAATFAIGFLPWVVGGPVLAALAERQPYRRVMITCDLLRMLTIGAVAIAPLPLFAILALLFLTSLLTPPFEAARSALLPRILSGDKYVVALSVNGVINQVAQLGGYLLGGVIAVASPRLGIAVDAATFGLSALLLAVGVRPGAPATTKAGRSHLLRETAEGFRVVFGHRVRRAIALVVFAVVMFPIVPEGLAAAWTAQLGAGPFAQAALMASAPVGAALGGVVIARFVPPAKRIALIRPLALLSPAILVPALLNPPYPVVLALATVSAFAGTGLVITCNGLFVQVLPAEFRARAFGIMAGGLYLLQGLPVAVMGVVGERSPVATVVGWWSLAGLALLALITLTWPPRPVIDAAVASLGGADGGHKPEIKGERATPRPTK